MKQKNNELSISAIITVHAEGSLAAISYQSFNEACLYAEARGVSVERILVLDNPSDQTQRVFDALEGVVILETNYGDQGLVRNKAVNTASGDLIAFLDGDDLWGDNWLYKAREHLLNEGENVIAHPEFGWFFQGVSSVFINTDQRDPVFKEDFLRFGNYWDAMCMAYRSLHLANPYCKRRISDGFAFEDWHWNCHTISNGAEHHVVADTIHFKRRRNNSQTSEASGNNSLMPNTELTDYRRQSS